MTNWIPVIVILVGAPLTTVIANHYSRPKIKADIAAQYNEMAFQLVKPQKDRIDELEVEMRERALECEERIDAVEAWAKMLYAHLLEVGETPMTFDQSVHLHCRKSDIQPREGTS